MMHASPLAIITERYRVQYGPGIFQRDRYLAGDDVRRLAELRAALASREIKAIFCARGGYGTMRLLRDLERTPPDANIGAAQVGTSGAASQAIIGFSDITALHQWRQSHGLVSIHGPVLTQLGRLGRPTSERLFSLLES